MKISTRILGMLLLLCSLKATSQSLCNFQFEWQTRYPGFVSPLTLDADNTGKPYIYAASNEYGLKIYKLDGTLATTIDTNLLQMRAMSFTQYGNLLYIAVGSHFPGSSDPPGLAIVDVSNPLLPLVKDVWVHPTVTGSTGAGIVKVEGDYAYLGGMGLGLIILNVNDPTNITFVSETPLSNVFPFAGPPAIDPKKYNLRGMEVKNKIVYGCYDAGGIRIINCTNVNSPFETGRYANPITYVPTNQPRAYNNIVLNDTVAYVAADYCGLEVLNIKDTGNITLMDNFNPHNAPVGYWWTSPIHASEMKYNVECKKLFMSTGKSEMIAMDVSNPNAIDSCGGYGSLLDTTGTWGIGMRNDSIFLSYLWVTVCIPPFCAFPADWNGIKLIKWVDPCVPLGIDENIETNIGSVKVVPNPFTSETAIRFWLRKQSDVEIRIVDIMGRTIKTYIRSQLNEGENVINWDGKNEQNATVSNGIYVVSIVSEGTSSTSKIIKLE